jgi:hypothetical protein
MLEIYFQSESFSCTAPYLHVMCASTWHSHAIPKMTLYRTSLQTSKLATLLIPWMFNMQWLVALDLLFGIKTKHAYTGTKGGSNLLTTSYYVCFPNQLNLCMDRKSSSIL